MSSNERQYDTVMPRPVSSRVLSGRGWDEYRVALDSHPAWRSISCRAPRVVSGNHGALVECPGTGPILELIMPEADLVETRPAPRFRGRAASKEPIPSLGGTVSP